MVRFRKVLEYSVQFVKFWEDLKRCGSTWGEFGSNFEDSVRSVKFCEDFGTMWDDFGLILKIRFDL